MKFKTAIAAAFAVALSCGQAFGQATILPPGESCFSANVGISGMLGLLGTITGGSGYVSGTYGGVSLTGGSGINATANITVSGGIVTQITILNPGAQYIVGDVLSASPSQLGGSGSGFSVPVGTTAINSALAGGSVAFYIPNTNSYKQTWQNAGETVLNQNPVPLDANGCAVIYGAGIYSMVVADSLGNTVYTALTASTGTSGPFWAGLAGGTPNAITITDTAFALQDGATIQYRSLYENTGPATISVSGGAQIAIVQDTATGPAALSPGQLGGPGNTPMITYDATGVEFHLVNPSASSGGSTSVSSVVTPQGYLNLVGQASGDVVQGASDVIGTGTIYYSPFVGNQVPIWNGSAFVSITFSETTATLTSAGSPTNSIQDACVFSNNGVPTLVIGPAWSTATAGAGNRGAGAGTAQITRLNGIWVNANSIIGYNGLSSYTIPADQCTYVGSLSIDATAGQVSAYRTWGQSRKWGVWNAYNRQQLYLLAGDATGSWTYGSNTFRPSNANTANSLTVFTGLPEEPVVASFAQFAASVSVSGSSTVSGGATLGIGWNSTTSPSGQQGQTSYVYSQTGNFTINLQTTAQANYTASPFIGINVVTSLEAVLNSSSSQTYYGAQPNMTLRAGWRG